MTDTKNKPECPHCGSLMKKWPTPLLSTWSSEFLWVCFNDECSYFVKGWDWMMKTREVSCSYRHSMDPDTGTESPLPVWSKDALKDDIIDE